MSELSKRLPDDFARSLLDGSLKVIGDASNPVRFHQSAATLRELFTYVLDFYAPEKQVRSCSWFVQAEDTRTVTRKQRAVYATQGGLSDEYVSAFGLDIDELHQDAISAINRLHAATHVKPDRLMSNQGEIDAFVEEVLTSLSGLLDSFEMVRATVCDTLEAEVYDAIMSAFVTESFEAIEEISGRGYEVSPFITIEDQSISAIDANTISLNVSGEAPVTLYHGPKDDGAEINHDCPFSMKFEAPVARPEKLTLTDSRVENTGWFDE